MANLLGLGRDFSHLKMHKVQIRGCLEIFLYTPNLSFWNLTASILLEIARYSSQNFLVRTQKSYVWQANTKSQKAS